ncbi:RHS repeat domain-containing protein [Zobellia laminariae]|uniref:RHS repeat domain-containing protein n=1 Tax=Zobellia laminariae TaxID=248906 RepID=UPI0026F41D2C|nr:RHS repeat-associated core domain-containing protein [Zobellia laminariae]WKX76178.1 RHS repeat-associated core domain-containing protein [Zobellia laminariae]
MEDCPFRYQGMYFDEETELCYNRFRYYDSSTGTYISQDPIGLESGNYNIYSYAHDSNIYVDPLGLVLGKSMPKNSWNYGNMPKIDNYQLHHVVPKSKASHPAIKAAGFDVNKPSNLIYLPKEQGIHPERSLHNGWNKQHAAYNLEMGDKLDKLYDKGMAQGWDQKKFHSEVDKLSKNTRQDLRKGRIKCH